MSHASFVALLTSLGITENTWVTPNKISSINLSSDGNQFLHRDTTMVYFDTTNDFIRLRFYRYNDTTEEYLRDDTFVADSYIDISYIAGITTRIN